MKTAAKFWSFALIIFLLLNFGDIATAQENKGYLQIISEQTGVEVLLNGNSIGKTPLPIISLNEGKYSLTAPNPSRFLWGQFDFYEEIEIIARDTLKVTLNFPEVIVFRSMPDGDAQWY